MQPAEIAQRLSEREWRVLRALPFDDLALPCEARWLLPAGLAMFEDARHSQRLVATKAGLAVRASLEMKNV